MQLRSLQSRFTLLVVVGATLLAAVAAPLTYRLGYAHAIEAERVTIGDLVTAVEKTAIAAAFTSDELLLQEVADGLGRNELVARVELRTAQGVRVRFGNANAKPAEGSSGVVMDRQLYSPFDPHESVGHLHIEANQALVESSARREASILMLVMTSQLALVAVLLHIAALRFVSHPIVSLARELRGLRPGTEQRLAIPKGHEHDEIGVLVEDANALLYSNNALLQANQVALQHERELRLQVATVEAQYRKIFDSTSAGIFVLDHSGRLINANPTVLKVVGSTVQEVRQLHGQDFIASTFARPDRVREMIEQSAQAGQTISADLELIRLGDQHRWVHCLISVQGGAENNTAADSAMIEGVIYDVTERKRAEQMARRQAEYDALTGLKNRAASEATIERFLADASSNHVGVSILYVDLDGFKRVNDTLSHAAGDEVLKECARRMLSAVRRSSDLVGRRGGDEFIVAMYNTTAADLCVSQVAAAIVESLHQPILLQDGHEVRIGASVGIACFPFHGDGMQKVLQAADAAMYQVKSYGKNAFAVALNQEGSAIRHAEGSSLMVRKNSSRAVSRQ